MQYLTLLLVLPSPESPYLVVDNTTCLWCLQCTLLRGWIF